MTLPILRRFSVPAGTINTPQKATDDETDQSFILLADANVLLDIVNDPDPTATNLYKISLFKAGDQTPIRAYSSGLSPESAGRIAIGPVNMSPGNYQVEITQTGGTAAAYSCVMKFDHPFEG